jgi:hypothetical protein
MIELDHYQLVFRFPEVHEDAVCRIAFQRTLRIPDDNRACALPPGLGCFPLHKALAGAEKLANLDSVAARHIKQGKGVPSDNDPVVPTKVTEIQGGKNRVREGVF